MAFLYTWDASFTALPPDNENASGGAGRIRDTKAALVERMLIDHSWAGDASDGLHKQVTMPELAVKPTVAANQGAVYTKDVSGLTELFYENSAGTEAQITSNGNAGAMTGEIKQVAFASVPAGWLPCDGASLLKASYLALWNAIGYTWGGSGLNFNVPDLRGRAVIGSGTGAGLTARTLGTQNIGEEAHTLTAAENGQHTHTITSTDAGHTHLLNYPAQSTTGSGSLPAPYHSSTPYGNPPTQTGYASITSTAANSPVASTDAHNNMQPSAVITFIIKT